MKSKQKTYRLILKSTVITALMMAIIPTAKAASYNFGTLDVQPLSNQGDTQPNWFVEYLKPGEQVQRHIRVSNFGKEEKNLNLYTADTYKNEGKEFFIKSSAEKSPDMAGWIELPAKNLTLQPGESTIVSVHFTIPKNAGVGLHTGAIIVRENAEMAMQKGIRLYVNVTGSMITDFAIQNGALTEKINNIEVQMNTANLGTTDYKTSYTAELRSLSGDVFSSAASSTLLKPNDSVTESINLTKPLFGWYQVYISSGSHSSLVKTIFFIPWWLAVLTISMLILTAAIIEKKSLRIPKFQQLQPNFYALLNEVLKSFRTLELQKSAAYFTLLTLVAVTTMHIANVDTKEIKSQILQPQSAPHESYEVTIKWGNVRGLILPENYRKNWEGRISFENAHITIMDLLHFEKEDNAEIKQEGKTIDFKVTTGPDNDGIVLKIDPVGTDIPRIIYEDFTKGTQREFKITDFLNTAGVFPDSVFAIYIKTEIKSDYTSPESLPEGEATSEIEATNEVNTPPPPPSTIPHLQNLFVQDLPPTPEVLAHFILDSDYVKDTVTEQTTKKMHVDKILREALQATPEVLAEIGASPDVNFIFIPTEKINFPPQEFSFQENKVSVQNLGTLIFVQNKETPWNTYVEATDLVSLSGKGTIPASSLTLIPGDATSLQGDNGAEIHPGDRRTFSGALDKAVLVNVDPAKNSQQMFTMNPILQISVPSGTLAGRYRGTLTITTL